MELEDAKPKGRWKTSDGHSMRSAHSPACHDKRKPVDPMAALKGYLALHPAARFAFEGYMRGDYVTVIKAAEAGCAQHPTDVKVASVTRCAEKYGWRAMRDIYKPRIAAAADAAAKAEMDKVNAVIGEYEAAVQALKPESPNNPKERLDWLKKVRANCREEIEKNPGGTTGLKTYELLQKIEADIAALCQDESDEEPLERAQARATYEALHDMVPPEDVLGDIKVPDGYVSPDFAARIEAQIAEQQQDWRK